MTIAELERLLKELTERVTRLEREKMHEALRGPQQPTGATP